MEENRKKFFLVYGKDLIGNSFKVLVYDEMKMGEFKYVLSKKYAEKKDFVHAHYMRVIHGGRNIDDSKTMRDYNVQEGDTIHIVRRLRGGDNFEKIDIITFIPFLVQMKGISAQNIFKYYKGKKKKKK